MFKCMAGPCSLPMKEWTESEGKSWRLGEALQVRGDPELLTGSATYDGLWAFLNLSKPLFSH